MYRNGKKKPVGFATHITAGGIAGGCEAVSYQTQGISDGSILLQLVCQPLDTIKVRMQLSKSGRAPGVSRDHLSVNTID